MPCCPAHNNSLLALMRWRLVLFALATRETKSIECSCYLHCSTPWPFPGSSCMRAFQCITSSLWSCQAEQREEVILNHNEGAAPWFYTSWSTFNVVYYCWALLYLDHQQRRTAEKKDAWLFNCFTSYTAGLHNLYVVATCNHVHNCCCKSWQMGKEDHCGMSVSKLGRSSHDKLLINLVHNIHPDWGWYIAQADLLVTNSYLWSHGDIAIHARSFWYNQGTTAAGMAECQEV
jgi:hypothetical protein